MFYMKKLAEVLRYYSGRKHNCFLIIVVVILKNEKMPEMSLGSKFDLKESSKNCS